MQRREALQILNKRLPPSFSTGVTDKMLDRILGKKMFLPRGNRVNRKEKDSQKWGI